MKESLRVKKVTASAVLTALGVALSPLFIPMGPTKVYPWQHMINGVAGVMLGPWYAALIATLVGLIRNGLGTGTIFAFPGGIPGALTVGFLHRHLIRRDYAALAEPIGTGLGGVLSALVVAPMALHTGVIKAAMPLQLFVGAFLASSIPGSIVGYLVLIALRRTGILQQLTLD
ncbi:MAG: energy coupling factor transporter S component ThiW [Candidatus Bathyarchaeia archaeon]|nr:energy coupling factor transporter S component ThiW [Candidatus Bathyarchaeota archaeon]